MRGSNTRTDPSPAGGGAARTPSADSHAVPVGAAHAQVKRPRPRIPRRAIVFMGSTNVPLFVWVHPQDAPPRVDVAPRAPFSYRPPSFPRPPHLYAAALLVRLRRQELLQRELEP